MSRQRRDAVEGDGGAPRLSERQRAILQLLMVGKANKDIAAELGIGLGTVKQHMVALFKKLNVTTRAMAISRGFAMDGQVTASIAPGQPEADAALELRPASVLSIALDPSTCEHTPREAVWSILQDACSLATSGLDAALVGRSASLGVDVIFGLHRVYEDNAVRAVRLARRITAMLAERLPDVVVRCGLSSGYLVASMDHGGMWTGEAMAGRVIAAAREQAQTAQPSTLSVDLTSRRLIAFARRAEGRGLPGVPEVLPLAETEPPRPPDILVPVETLVGRVAERRALLETAWQVERGQGALVWVEGESGMGKTTLCNAFGMECRTKGFDWVSSRCGAAGTSVVDILATLAGAAPVWSEGYFEAVAETLAERMARRPMVLLVDDLHLVEPNEAALICRLVGLMPSMPLLLLGAGRKIRYPALVALAPSTVVRLSHLSQAEIEDVVKAQGAALTPALTTDIAYRAGGVPLFAAELVNEEKALPGSNAQVPLTLVTLILSRLDGLALDHRLLALLAQKGEMCLAEVMAGWPGDQASLGNAIDRAVQSGILVRRPGKKAVEDVLTFHHPLLTEALRRVLLDQQLATLERAMSGHMVS